MIEIQQAIFGEGRDRGHALLASSFPTDTIPNQLSGFTDLVDRPRDGELTQPVTRGLFAKDHFLFIRSFPDSSGRQGRVFSHALILKKDDFLKVQDISMLLPFLMAMADKQPELRTIKFANTDAANIVTHTNADQVAVMGLVDHISFDNTIVWLNETSFWDWISKIWRQIPDPVKLNIRLGSAFNPSRVNTSLLNLLYLPDAAKNNWQREKFLIVDETAKKADPNPLADHLLGGGNKSSNFNTIISELNPAITEIDDLRVIAGYADLYSHIDQAPTVKSLLMLSGLMARYNPNPKSSVSGKQKILLALARMITTAKAEEISYLQHQTWTGFDVADVEKNIGVALNRWLDKNLLKDSNDLEVAKLAVTALRAKKTNWWHGFTIAYINRLWQHWQPSYSKHWWNWVKTDLNVADATMPILPAQAEKAIVDELPSLNKVSKEKILELSIGKKWYSLFGMTAISYYSSKEAFDKVIAVVEYKELPLLLSKMAAKISNQKLIADAALINNSILNDLAATQIKSNSSLKKGLAPIQPGWQQIWLLSVQKGLPIWDGVDKPLAVVYDIMDLLIKGGELNKELLRCISSEKYNSLKKYTNRKLIWDFLPENSKIGFMTATLSDCLQDIATGTLKLGDLEKPLRDAFDSPAVLQAIIMDHQLTVKVKLDLLKATSKFGEQDAERLLYHNRFGTSEAGIFGAMVRDKHWKSVASSIFSIRKTRPDLEPSLRQCYSLLGFWERLNLAANGFGSALISTDEGWEILLQKVIDHYPDGPNQNGIWENAGGKRSDLHTSGSGKQIWTAAVTHMKNGGHPKPKKLLSKMIEEFPFDGSLKELNQII